MRSVRHCAGFATMLAVAGVVCACTQSPRMTPADASLLGAAVVPPPPSDPSSPLARVIWVLNYDMREYDAALAWLRDEVPDGPQRTRALALIYMLGMAELGRKELIAPGIAYFEDAIRAFPGDGRLRLWHAYMSYMGGWVRGDDQALEKGLELLWACIEYDRRFNLAGPELTVAGNPKSSAQVLRRARDTLYGIMAATLDLQFATDEASRAHLRRNWNSPITPYLIPATFVMKGDISLLIDDKDTARREYYKAMHENSSYRWPWRTEAARRFEHLEEVYAGLHADPPTQYVLGSTFPWAMGIDERYRIETFGGRVGNGSCSFCHTHVSAFDSPESRTEPIGWIRGRFVVDGDVPDPAPYFFAMPSTKEGEKPVGLSIGLDVPAEAPRDFYLSDAYYDGTYLLAAPPGRYFVAGTISTGDDGTGLLGDKEYRGYTKRWFGLPRYFEVAAGMVTDATDVPVRLRLQ